MSKVQNHVQASRYERYEDGRVTALLQYRMENDQMWLLDTQTVSEQVNQSMVDEFLLGVLQDVHRRRIEVLPFCPRVRQFMMENPQFLRSIPAKPPGHFPLLQDAVAILQGAAVSVATSKKGGSDGAFAGAARVPPEAVVHSLRSRRLKQMRQEKFRSMAVAAAAAELAPDEAVS